MLFTHSSDQEAAVPCLYRPREDLTSLWFKHAWQQARGEDCWAIAKRPGGKPQTFHSCLLLAPPWLHTARAARKTRREGAELHHQGLLWQKGKNLHKQSHQAALHASSATCGVVAYSLKRTNAGFCTWDGATSNICTHRGLEAGQEPYGKESGDSG